MKFSSFQSAEKMSLKTHLKKETILKKNKMSKQEFFIEKREQGDYAIRKPNSKRASDVESTQKEAIEKAKQLDPDATVHVERVRYTDRDKPDKWRSV